MNAARKAYNYVDESIKKIQQKEWAEPVGPAMAVTGTICSEIGNFVPGFSLVGGALSFGASILNPEPSIEDIQKEMKEMTQAMNSMSEEFVTAKDIMKERIEKLEAKIENPSPELRTDHKLINNEVNSLLNVISEENFKISDEVSQMKELISKTFSLVVDVRYKVK